MLGEVVISPLQTHFPIDYIYLLSEVSLKFNQIDSSVNSIACSGLAVPPKYGKWLRG